MLGRSLLHQGLVEQTSDGYAVLLNALSWEVMRRQRLSLSPFAVQTPQQEPWEMRATEVEMLFQRLRSPANS